VTSTVAETRDVACRKKEKNAVLHILFVSCSRKDMLNIVDDDFFLLPEV
jgi:hypothetical protein